ncbi:hypothetical protein N3114_12765 (plasmid) [Aliarcobacter butzleri]|uniref:hypothetical protein n=1 Tax=Aliarcobacter butzleri TaxID=28197 RepID=UPI0021B42707|nr:hypothetical protein [Aliarcobacter butzleri]UXC30727.1 hypothetical protein N3114_12765 [Aliarcobacter butzleri]
MKYGVYLLDLCGASLQETFKKKKKAKKFINKSEKEIVKGSFAVSFEIRKIKK